MCVCYVYYLLSPELVGSQLFVCSACFFFFCLIYYRGVCSAVVAEVYDNQVIRTKSDAHDYPAVPVPVPIPIYQ